MKLTDPRTDKIQEALNTILGDFPDINEEEYFGAWEFLVSSGSIKYLSKKLQQKAQHLINLGIISKEP